MSSLVPPPKPKSSKRKETVPDKTLEPSLKTPTKENVQRIEQLESITDHSTGEIAYLRKELAKRDEILNEMLEKL